MISQRLGVAKQPYEKLNMKPELKEEREKVEDGDVMRKEHTLREKIAYSTDELKCWLKHRCERRESRQSVNVGR